MCTFPIGLLMVEQLKPTVCAMEAREIEWGVGGGRGIGIQNWEIIAKDIAYYKFKISLWNYNTYNSITNIYQQNRTSPLRICNDLGCW